MRPAMSHRLRSWAARAPLGGAVLLAAIGILLPATPVRAAKVVTVASQHPSRPLSEERASLPRLHRAKRPGAGSPGRHGQCVGQARRPYGRIR